MTGNRGEILLQIARHSIREELYPETDSVQPDKINEKHDWLQQQAACFITLTKNDDLRGCIGTLDAYRPLYEDVRQNAKGAAFHDTRFSPLRAEEFDEIELEISLLSSMHAMTFDSEQNLLSQIRPGEDGIVFEYDYHRSTFLPQVWEQLPDARDFFSHLKQKAGLSLDFWSDRVKVYRYSVSKWKESDFMQTDGYQTDKR